jgi:DnaJ-class molecular chaperone
VQIDLDVPASVAARGGSVTAVYHRMQRADSWRPGTDDAGLVRVQDIADIRIVPGTRNGSILREKALGDAGPFGGAYGDLIARVRITGPGTPHSAGPSTSPASAEPVGAGAPEGRPAEPSVRSGLEDEVVTLEINVTEAILGGRVALETPQGKVRLTIPPGTSGGTRLRLKGKGSPLANGTIGDLYVELRIVVPKVLDAESRRLIEEFAKLNP